MTIQKIFNFIRLNFHPFYLLYKFNFFRKILKNVNFVLLKKSNKFGNYFISLPRHATYYLDEAGYEKKTFDFIKSLDKNLLLNKTFLDIGSNIGFYSLFLKKNYNSKIIIFEPNSDNLLLLYKTLKKNKFNDFFIFPYAVSDKTSVKKMLIDDVTGRTGSIAYNENDFQKKVAPPTLRLEINKFQDVIAIKLDDVNDLNLEDLSLVKIDVEGHELEVIAGMINIIKKYLPVIIVETGENNLENIKNLLFPLNYQLIKINLKPNFAFIR